MVYFKLQRSTKRPTKGNATAETTMKVVTARERVDRLTSRSSDMGLSIRPNANLEPPLKNRMKNPVARITQL
jgi:hypothetical protein